MLLWNQGGLDGDATCCTITRIQRALQLFETTLLTVGCSNRWLGIGLWLSCGLPESVRVNLFTEVQLDKKTTPVFCLSACSITFLSSCRAKSRIFADGRAMKRVMKRKTWAVRRLRCFAPVSWKKTPYGHKQYSQKKWDVAPEKLSGNDVLMGSWIACVVANLCLYTCICSDAEQIVTTTKQIWALSFLWQQNTTCYNVDQ